MIKQTGGEDDLSTDLVSVRDGGGYSGILRVVVDGNEMALFIKAS